MIFRCQKNEKNSLDESKIIMNRLRINRKLPYIFDILICEIVRKKEIACPNPIIKRKSYEYIK